MILALDFSRVYVVALFRTVLLRRASKAPCSKCDTAAVNHRLIYGAVTRGANGHFQLMQPFADKRAERCPGLPFLP